MLAHSDLGMIDAINHRTKEHSPNTSIRGSRKIDGAWVTLNVDISRVCFLPFFFGVGDHQGTILDIPQRTLLGGDSHSIMLLMARRLTCNKHVVQAKYNNLLELYCVNHRIQQKIYPLFPTTYPPNQATSQTMEVIDRVI